VLRNQQKPCDLPKELQPLNTQKGVAYCQLGQICVTQKPEILYLTWFSDVSRFHLSTQKNRRVGCAYLMPSTRNPSTHRKRVCNVLCQIPRITGQISSFHTTANTDIYLDIYQELVKTAVKPGAGNRRFSTKRNILGDFEKDTVCS
jgi:hypothetical protein